MTAGRFRTRSAPLQLADAVIAVFLLFFFAMRRVPPNL